MKLLLVDNIHLYRTPEGLYFTPSIYTYDFFQRYLNVFDSIKLLCKVKHVNSIEKEKMILVTRDGLEIQELPWYQGIRQMIPLVAKLNKIYKKAGEGCECIIYRVAQIESFWTYLHKSNRRKPFAVEVVNDPATFTNTNIIIKALSILLLKRMTYRAIGASYVTQHYLQKKYPSYLHKNPNSHNHFNASYSSVEIDKTEILTPKKFNSNSTIRLLHIGNSINDNTKGQIQVLKIGCELIKKHYNISIHFIGDGTYLEEIKKQADKLNMREKCIFYGRISDRKELLTLISSMDIMLYPTRMEGLPRVIIESMAMGLPVLSTPIAGIPEIVQEENLFKQLDIEGFVARLEFLMNNQEVLESISSSNIKIAMAFVNERLNPKRTSFYIRLRMYVDSQKT